MRYREALAEGTAALEKAGIETARLDAWHLLEHVCHITRQYFYLNDTDELKEEETNVITAAKEESKNNYDVEIRKAEEEKDNAIKEMSSSIKSLREQYESAKKESAKRVLDELFQSI